MVPDSNYDTRSHPKLRLGSKIISALDVVFGLAGVAGGIYCLSQKDVAGLEIVGYILLPIGLVNVLTGGLLLVGVVKELRALLILWMVKAFSYMLFLFPIGTIYYGLLAPVVLFLYIRLGESSGAVISGPSASQLGVPAGVVYYNRGLDSNTGHVHYRY